MTRTLGDAVSIRRGALAGASAWIVIAVVTHATLRTATLFDDIWARGVAEAPITITLGAILDVHGWFLGTTLSGTIAPLSVVPIAVLLAGGFWAASGGNPRSPVAGLAGGATVIAGYLALLIVSIVVMLAIGSDSGSDAGGTMILKVVLTGIVYPIVFGGLGGAVASQVGSAATGSGAAAGP